MWAQVVRYDLFSSAVFLPYFSMLILSLPLFGLGSKSTSFSPGFCVCIPRQYYTICWELNLISGFFAFFRLIVWPDGINKCGWCPLGGRWCWLKGLHQIPSVRWIIHHLTLPHLLDCLICTRTSVSTVLLVWMMGGWDRWGVVDSYQGLGGGTGGWYYLISHSFFHFSCVLLSFEQLFTYIYYILYIYIYIYINTLCCEKLMCFYI